jgi:hypothetical protein
MAKTTHPAALGHLAWALEALAGRLGPGEASAAAQQALRAMGKTTEPAALYSLARALAALAGRLGPGEAARYTSAAAQQVLRAMAKTTHLGHLAWALEALAGRLGQEEALEATQKVLEAMGMTTDPPALLSSLAPALAVRLEPEEASERTGLAARAIAEGLAPPTRLSGLATLLRASQPLPGRFSTQELIDLLKMPTCVGPAREVILRQLGQKCNRPFADLWEFVDWAHEHRPDLDLTTPPKRSQK